MVNYDKKRENNGKQRNPGLAILILEELKQYFLDSRRPRLFFDPRLTAENVTHTFFL